MVDLPRKYFYRGQDIETMSKEELIEALKVMYSIKADEISSRERFERLTASIKAAQECPHCGNEMPIATRVCGECGKDCKS